MPLTDGQKEQIKLTSTYLNGVAIGIILIGGLSLPVTLSLAAVDSVVREFALPLSLSSVVGSPYVHYLARRNLRKLDR